MAAATAPVRIVVCDDHPVVRAGLRLLLGTIEGFDVVGEAGDGAAAVREVQLLQPDVVLLDVNMPEVDGVEAARQIRETTPATAVVMLTMYDDGATLLTAMQAGARGYLLKGADQAEIVNSIRAAAAGQVIFAPSVAARLLEGAVVPDVEPPDAFADLTPREHDILAALARGLRTAAIAEQLFLSPKTVSNCLTTIFAKLQVANRSEAIVRAREGGLGR